MELQNIAGFDVFYDRGTRSGITVVIARDSSGQVVYKEKFFGYTDQEIRSIVETNVRLVQLAERQQESEDNEKRDR